MITYIEILDDRGKKWTWDGDKVFKNGEEEDYCFEADTFEDACAYLVDTGFFFRKLKLIIE